MEDPWGSPWASADALSENHASTSAQTNAFLSPPPRAFFSNATSFSNQLALPGSHDNGPGIVATVGRTDGTDIQNDWGVWGEASVQPPRLSPRLSVSGRMSPLVWPESTEPSPILAARSRSRTPSILRHHSPDPWATEPSFLSRSKFDPQSSPNPTRNDTPTVETKPVEEYSQPPETITTNIAAGSLAKRGLLVDRDASNGAGAGAFEESEPTRTSPDLADKHEDTSSKLDREVHELPSRPVSTITLGSQDEYDRQDSPNTSIDEDQAGRLQRKLRNISEDSQELDGVDNGLAKTASGEPPILELGEALGAPSHEKSQEATKKEDVRDGILAHPSSDAFSGLPSTLDAGPVREKGGERIAGTGTYPIPSQNLANNFAGLTFDTNLGLLDKLFPSLTDSPENSAVESWCETPTHLVSDSFATISERKAWYRISRYGSMRKHNFGDDENYARITWSASQLHSDTIRTVRRWMEQDSYAGKAVLGGTKRVGFFDWDSEAAPVELDEVFRRTKPVIKHTRTTSIPATTSETTRRLRQEERPYRNSTGITFASNLPPASSPIMPIPSFGWKSEPWSIPPPPSTQLSHHSVQPPTQTSGPGHRPVLSHPPISIQTTFANGDGEKGEDKNEAEAEDEDEDEDDWGEMVSSPVIEKRTLSSVSAFTPSETITENQCPILPDMTKSVEPKPPSPLIAQPTPSDLPPSSDMSELKGLDLKELTSPTRHAPDTPTHAATPVIVSTPNIDSSPVREKESVFEFETLGRSTTSVQAAANEACSTTVPTMNPMTSPDVANLPRSESHDNIIIQDILRNLPDLSYMLR